VLGSSDLKVSEVCFGTMTFGQQNSQEEAFEMLDYAVSKGINFLDTAEMYPVPPIEKTQGASEVIIGEWLKARKNRKDIIIATKVSGRSEAKSYVTKSRGQGERKVSTLDKKSILLACDASLKRLQTDYIDLYQIHWPARYVPLFGKSLYDKGKERDKKEYASFDDQVQAMGELIKAKKIRYWGLSNESTWGVCQFLFACKKYGVPPPVTIQNSYSLLHRNFEYELAEACSPSNGNISLLPWSILAGGRLTGKYIGGKKPAKARNTLFPNFQDRYFRPELEEPLLAYEKIAKELGVSLTVLAHAFCKSKWFIGSTIIGATSLKQLKENIDAFTVTLPKLTLDEINEVHRKYPNASNLDG